MSTGHQWTRFLHVYYLLNTILIISYVPIRTHVPHEALAKLDPYFGIPKETEIVMLMVFFIISKYKKKATVDGFINSVFLYCKTGLALLYYYLGMQYFGWYCILCLVLFLTLRQPKYMGPENIIHLNAEAFDRRIRENSAEKNVRWLVYFYADWCDTCLQHDAMFAELSLSYSSPQLKFAKLDLGRYPEVGHELGINVSSTSWQLPTLILFEKRKEQQRLPPIDGKGNVVKTILDRKGIVKVFQLSSPSR